MSLRGQSKIPIPSFAIPPVGNTQGTTQQQQQQLQQQEEEEKQPQEQPHDATLIQLPVNEQVMIRLEIALQLYCHQQQNSKSDRISFSEFCKIASKVDTTTSTSSSTDISALPEENEEKVVDAGDGKGDDHDYDDDSKNPIKLKNTLTQDSLRLWKLSKEERFWHDVYCVAIPALYRAGDGNDNEGSDKTATGYTEEKKNSSSSSSISSSNSNVNIHPNKERRIAAAARLALTTTTTTTTGMSVATTGTKGNHNRLKELRRLIREARTRGILKARSDRAFRLLLTLRQEATRHVYNKTKAKVVAGGAAISVGDCSTRSSNGKNIENQNNKHYKLGTADFLLRDPISSTASTAHHNNNNNNNNGIGKSGGENIKHNFGGSKTTTTTTTIDDRIRARARERENNLQQARAARKDPREERVAIADALYSYACHIIRRKRKRSRSQPQSQPRTNRGTTQLLGRGEQRGLSSSSSSRFLDRTTTTNNIASTAATNTTTTTATTAPSKCIITFNEVVKSGLANRSRKEITRLFSDIVQVLSESSSSSSSITSVFLKWRNPKTGETNTTPIAKNATVWIDTTAFKRVREILNREQLSKMAFANSKDGKKRTTSNGENDGDNETKRKKKSQQK